MTVRGFFLPREKTHQKRRKNPPVKGLSKEEKYRDRHAALILSVLTSHGFHCVYLFFLHILAVLNM